jgi:hypothetical protein
VALEACEGMLAGYDRLMSLPPQAFLPPPPPLPTTTACCRHNIPGWSSPTPPSTSTLPPAHALLTALLKSPTKSLPLPTAAAATQTTTELGLGHLLLTEDSPVLLLLPGPRAGDPPHVAFASPLAERFGHAYLSAYRHHAAGGAAAGELVVAALSGLGGEEGVEGEGNKKGGRKGARGGLVSTALLAASAALYLAATCGGSNGNGNGGGSGGGGGGYRGLDIALPPHAPADWDWAALHTAAQGALGASAGIARDTARAVVGQLAAASHALGETLAAAAATAASHASTPLKAARRGGGGGGGGDGGGGGQ